MGILDTLTGGKRPPILGGGMDSVIGENAQFKGELTTSGSVNINGGFEGKIRAEGEVIVSPGGKVVGEIHGGSVVISGRVDGNIVAKDTLEVARSGRVHGDLTGSKIVIEEGSTYHGRVKVESEIIEEAEEAAETPSTKTSAPSSEPQVQIFPNF